MRRALTILAILLLGCSDSSAPPGDSGSELGPDAARDLSPPGDGPLSDAADAAGDSATDMWDGDLTSDAGSCAPAAPQATLPLFTALKQDLALLSDAAARTARVDQFMQTLQQSNAYPLRDQNNVVLLYRGTNGAGLSVAGTFNGWQPGTDLLAQVAGTDLYAAELTPGSGRHEYKLVTSGGAWLQDPLNPHVTWDGIAKTGLGEFNSVVPAWGTASAAAGQLRWMRVASPQLQNTRDVYVYLPAAYAQDSCTRYPVLLVNDGNESITRGHFDQVADAVFAAAKASPAILVFVALAHQNDRMSEYSCDPADDGPKYTNFVCDTLLPLVDQRFRTQTTPDSRGMAGASLGGLISYAALWWRNDCLRRAAGQSGSFFYKDDMMIKRVQDSSPAPNLVRAYLDNGVDNRVSTQQMRDALQAKGYSVYHWEKLTQDHTWDAWQDRFDELLGHLYP